MQYDSSQQVQIINNLYYDVLFQFVLLLIILLLQIGTYILIVIYVIRQNRKIQEHEKREGDLS
jgi:uncharacterized membrane protein